MVCGILVRHCFVCVRSIRLTLTTREQSYNFGWDFAAITVITMAAYSWFTIKTTSWRCVASLCNCYAADSDALCT